MARDASGHLTPVTTSEMAASFPATLAALYFLLSFSLSFPTTALGLYLTNDLHFSPVQTALYYGTTFSVWSFKIVFGALSETFPICGYRRAPYLVLFNACASVSFLALAQFASSFGTALYLGVLVNVGLYGAELMIDSLVVERVKEEADVGRVQASCQVFRSLGTAAATLLSLLLMPHFPLSLGYSLTPPAFLRVASLFPLASILIIAIAAAAAKGGAAAAASRAPSADDDAAMQSVTSLPPLPPARRSTPPPHSRRCCSTGSGCCCCCPVVVDFALGDSRVTAHPSQLHRLSRLAASVRDLLFPVLPPPPPSSTAPPSSSSSCSPCPSSARRAPSFSSLAHTTPMFTQLEEEEGEGAAASGSGSGSSGRSSPWQAAGITAPLARRGWRCCGRWLNVRLCQFLLFVFVCGATPSMSGPYYNFQISKHGLALPGWVLSSLTVVWAAASILAALAYRRFLAGRSLWTVLVVTRLLGVAASLSQLLLVTHYYRVLGMSATSLAMIDQAFTGFGFQLSFLPILVIAARACPSGLEAAVFALFLTANDVASTVGDFSGAALTQALGITAADFSSLRTLVLICSLAKLLPLLLFFPVRASIRQLSDTPPPASAAATGGGEGGAEEEEEEQATLLPLSAIA